MTWSAPYPSKLFKYISENDAKYVAFSIRSDGDGSIAKHIVNMIICPIKALVDEHMQQAQNIWNEIDSLDFNIHQVQKMDEVKDGIYQLQHIYKENNMNTKFLFGVLSSRMLKCQFDIKEELNSLVHNNALIERDLEECKANL